ncbi:hypothetical protein J6590_095033 [Homalodisca vitripennis]|nr:hypothetical protein J6590_095033 [Homalodisca vitripennis]
MGLVEVQELNVKIQELAKSIVVLKGEVIVAMEDIYVNYTSTLDDTNHLVNEVKNLETQLDHVTDCIDNKIPYFFFFFFFFLGAAYCHALKPQGPFAHPENTMRTTSLQLQQFNKPPKTTYQVLLGKLATPVQATKDGIPLSCYCWAIKEQVLSSLLLLITPSTERILLKDTNSGISSFVPRNPLMTRNPTNGYIVDSGKGGNGLIAIPNQFGFDCARIQRHQRCLTVRENVNRLAPISQTKILTSTFHNGCDLRLKDCRIRTHRNHQLLHGLTPRIPAPVPLFVLEPSVYHSSSAGGRGCFPSDQSSLEGKIILKGLSKENFCGI